MKARIFWFLAALAGAATLASAPTFARCNPPAAKIVINVRAGDTTVDRAMSIARLSSRNVNANRPDLAKYEHSLGLTESAVAAQANVVSAFQQTSKGVCASVKELTIEVGWASRVHIASEIVKNSCIWDAVLTHERRHVAVNDKLLQELPDYFTDAVKDHLGYVEAGSKEAAARQLKAQIDAVLEDALKQHRAIQDRLQAKIDTPEEYDRLPRQCGREAVAALLKKSH